MLRLVVGLSAVALANNATAGPLWQNTRAGMTLAELKAAQPSLVPAAPEGTGKHRKKCEYTVGEVKIGSMTFDSCFHFQNSKLVLVGLYQTDMEEVSIYYPDLKSMLASKYGAAVMQDTCSGGASVRTCETIFKGEGGTTITAGGMSIMGKTHGSVTYEALPEGADRL